MEAVSLNQHIQRVSYQYKNISKAVNVRLVSITTIFTHNLSSNINFGFMAMLLKYIS
jgi:hypothetical protein